MKNILFLFLFAALWAGCSNEFELTEDKVETPVIYGLLDQDEPIHYVRLERIFLDKNQSALEIAQNPDSLYYPENGADLLISNVTKGLMDVKMQRINAEEEGINREDGIFATSPNILYKIGQEDILLEQGDEIIIEARLSDGRKATSSTKIIEKPRLSKPGLTSLIDFNLTGQTTNAFFPGDDSFLHSIIYNFNISEIRTSGIERKTIEWTVLRNSEKNEIRFSGAEFYTLIANNLEVEVNTDRIFNGADYKVISGGEELLNYFRVGQANLGITSSGEVPTYTNIEGGLGLFSSIATSIAEDRPLSGKTMENLRDSDITSDLNFQ